MKPQPWKTFQSRQVYKNPWMSLREDIAELPDRRTTIYGVVTFGAKMFLRRGTGEGLRKKMNIEHPTSNIEC